MWILESKGRKVFKISTQVFEQFEDLVPNDFLERASEVVLAGEGIQSTAELSVVIADDDTVRRLNKEHRGLDENTDVLSFAFDHEGEYYGEDEPSSEFSHDIEFVMPPGEVEGLGEVIISYPMAERQAQVAGHSVVRELAHLLAHGILHLLGYDHLEGKDEAEMQAREAEVLAQVLNEDE